MKKVLSACLAVCMACSLAVPAAAAQQTDERLAAVTAQVKQTLNLDTEAYTEFHGELDDNPLSPTWYLDWQGEDAYLTVTATEQGKILSYYYSPSSAQSSSSQFPPSFPEGDRESAKAAAEDFLARVLEDGESALWDDTRGDANSLGATRYRFYGEILVNGLSAGLSFSISVRCEDNAVLSFYRDSLEGMVMGDIPAPQAGVTAAQAAQTLRSTLKLRLEYVLPEDGGTTAVLRYLPEYGDEYYVAADGALVNLSELFRQAGEGVFGAGSSGGDNATAEDAGTESSLSTAEQEGIAKMEGVLDRSALDSKVRGLTALGLDSYTLATVTYSVGREADENGVTPVTASLVYGKQVGDATWRRTATVDARTGQLLSLYSSGRLGEDGPGRTVDAGAAQTAAEDFLHDIAPAQFAKTDLYESYDALENETSRFHSFTFAQKENGYFYTGNYFCVGVDTTDGSISSYETVFDDTVTFDDPAGILSADDALDAWLATYEVQLQYIPVPAAIDFSQPEYAPLAGTGLTYLYRLALGYQLEREEYLLGIDAKTGQPVARAQAEEQAMAYSDVAGHWAQAQIETLAGYGVGYTSSSFLPDQALTQLDLVALLMSTQGYLYYPDQEGAADELYDQAYAWGLLKKGERDDGALLTRAQTVKFILDASGYGPIAQLDGIFRTSFADDGEIPAEYYGYAALAQGLGLVGGTPGGSFLPDQTATRAQAAVMLYNLMAR